MEYGIPHTVNTYYDLELPDDQTTGLPLLIATHGYGGCKHSMMRLAKKVDVNRRFAIASLQGIHQHFKKLGDPKNHKQDIGYGWLSPWKPEESKQTHHASIDAIVNRLVDEGTVEPDKVFLLGFSQSVALNLRYALTFPGRIRGVVGICGGVPYDLSESSLYHREATDMLAVHMDRDEFYPPERVSQNMEAVIPFVRTWEMETFEGGHTIAPGMFPRIMDWLDKRLGGE